MSIKPIENAPVTGKPTTNEDPRLTEMLTAMPVDQLFVLDVNKKPTAAGMTMTQIKDMRDMADELAKAMASNQIVKVNSNGKIPATMLPELFTGRYADLEGAPTLEAVATTGRYSDLHDLPVLFSGDYNDLSNRPEIPVPVDSDWTARQGSAGYIKNKPSLFDGKYDSLTGRPILFSGDYNDLANRPTIPSAPVNADWNATTGLAQIKNKPALFSGDYNDLANKPIIPAAQVQADWLATAGAAVIKNKPTIPAAVKQETLLGSTSTAAGPTLGVIEFVFTGTYTNVPHVNPSLIGAAPGVMYSLTNVTNKGCRITCYQRNAVTLLAVEVLLAAVLPVGGVSVGLLVISRD